MTSLDMAGCSLTLIWLDDELERCGRAPADTPAYRKGLADRTGNGRCAPCAPVVAPSRGGGTAASASPGVAAAAARPSCRRWRRWRQPSATPSDELGRIDAVAGDGDHGRGMVKGITAAAEAAGQAASRAPARRAVLDAAGDAWAAKAGGTSGVLVGRRLARRRGVGSATTADDRSPTRRRRAPYGPAWRPCNASARPRSVTRPCSTPSCRSSTRSSTGRDGRRRRSPCLEPAARGRGAAAEATAELRPQIGRARPLAERSVGTPDAGAISMALVPGPSSACAARSAGSH